MRFPSRLARARRRPTRRCSLQRDVSASERRARLPLTLDRDLAMNPRAGKQIAAEKKQIGGFGESARRRSLRTLIRPSKLIQRGVGASSRCARGIPRMSNKTSGHCPGLWPSILFAFRVSAAGYSMNIIRVRFIFGNLKIPRAGRKHRAGESLHLRPSSAKTLAAPFARIARRGGLLASAAHPRQRDYR